MTSSRDRHGSPAATSTPPAQEHPRQLPDISWRALTTDRHKFDRFTDDPDFVQGLSFASDALGAETGAVLRRHALLLIQPDCLARRMAHHCVDLVRQRGFQPVHAIRVHLTPAIVGALWPHRSDNSTPDGDIIAELVCGRSDSLLLLLRDTAPEPETPASLRLTRFKGPSRAERRTTTQLRSLLGARDRLIVLIHTPDEPADMLRESTAICGPNAAELYPTMTAAIPSDAASHLHEQIEALYRHTPEHDLDPDAALTRLRTALHAAASNPRHTTIADQLLSTLDRVQYHHSVLDWDPLARGLHQLGIDPTQWDPILVASRYAEIEHPPGEFPGHGSASSRATT